MHFIEKIKTIKLRWQSFPFLAFFYMYIFQKIMENSVSRKLIAMEWNDTLVLCISLYDTCIIQLFGQCHSEFQQFVHTGIPIFVSDFMDGPASNAFIENILFLNNRKILDRFFFIYDRWKKTVEHKW